MLCYFGYNVTRCLVIYHLRGQPLLSLRPKQPQSIPRVLCSCKLTHMVDFINVNFKGNYLVDGSRALIQTTNDLKSNLSFKTSRWMDTFARVVNHLHHPGSDNPCFLVNSNHVIRQIVIHDS